MLLEASILQHFSLVLGRGPPSNLASLNFWSLPLTWFIKLNFNGALEGNRGSKGYGWVFGDDNVSMMLFSRHIDISMNNVDGI